MNRIWFVLMVFLVCIPVLAQEKETQYQEGKILSVTELEHSSMGGTDAPTAAPRNRYDISVQVVDTVYNCRYEAMRDQDLSWLSGKVVQVRVKGKTMFVKRANGSEANAKIRSTHKATTP